jgi:23S rRNA pseudouridine1911/1915/1917 synthase
MRDQEERIIIEADRCPVDRLVVIHDDGSIVVACKPSGMPSVDQPGKGKKSAYAALLERDRSRGFSGRQRIAVVHRLDRDTSGVMVFARGAALKAEIMGGWSDLVEERHYLALIEGRPPEPRGLLRSWMRENAAGMAWSSSEPPGLEAVTRFETIGALGPLTLLRLSLETGRRNQIRAQMAMLKAPVAGDTKYGARSDPLGRLCLHAESIILRIPSNRMLIEARCPAPAGFYAPKGADRGRRRRS